MKFYSKFYFKLQPES